MFNSNFNKDCTGKKRKLSQGYSIFSSLFVTVFFTFSTLLYSQNQQDKTKAEESIIIIYDGGSVFSADENFNRQVLSNQTVSGNSRISYLKNDDDSSYLVLEGKESVHQKDSSVSHFNTETERDKIADLQNIVQNFLEENRFESSDVFCEFPLSQEFFSASNHETKFISSSANDCIKKLSYSEQLIFILKALDFLHTESYHHYNSKSLGFCCYEAFSVRPPPVSI